MKYVALLRAINLGKHNKIPMPALREVFGSLGYSNVKTYLQSGNVVFDSAATSPASLSSEIERAITEAVGLSITVFIRTPKELASIIKNNPFSNLVETPTHLHVCFLSSNPDNERIKGIDRRQYEPDEFQLGSGVIYLTYPNGAGRTKLTNDLIERRLAIRATTRNWNTVTSLLKLTTP